MRVLVGMLVLSACGHPAPPAAPAVTCAPRAGAEAGVTKAMVDFYAALQTDDVARFRALVAPDFYAFERGKRMDGDALAKGIADAHAQGRKFEWNVTQPQVVADCTLAVITYVNVGAIGDASGMKPRSWLESAALSYDAGAWRLRVFHSTPVPQE